MTLYRLTVWFVKGLREYTRNGYQSASKYFCEEDLDVDCSGKVYMITGANSGIGECVARQVALHGGTVHMVCRNAELANMTKNNIIASSRNENVHIHVVDLSKSRDVFKFAEEFRQSHSKLDVLVNNAGCMLHEHQVNADGVELNFATNVLAPHILTRVLKPLLSESEHGRVIMVTSGGMLLEKLNVEDPQLERESSFDGTKVYAQNKRQMVVMAKNYAAQNKELFTASVHPGWADTPAVRSAMPDFHRRMESRLRTPEQGADTILWLAVSKAALKHSGGLFFQDRSPVSIHLPLAWTQSSPEEEGTFMNYLDKLSDSVGATASNLPDICLR